MDGLIDGWVDKLKGEERVKASHTNLLSHTDFSYCVMLLTKVQFFPINPPTSLDAAKNN